MKEVAWKIKIVMFYFTFHRENVVHVGAHAAFKHIDPFYFTIIRYGSVTIILVAILLWKEGKKLFDLKEKVFTYGFSVQWRLRSIIYSSSRGENYW